MADKAQSAAGKLKREASEKASDAADYVKAKAPNTEELKGMAKEGADKAGQWAKEGKEWAKEEAGKAGQWAKENKEWAKEEIQEKEKTAADMASDAINAVKEKAPQA